MKYSLQLRGKGWGNVPDVEVWLWNILPSCSVGRCWNDTDMENPTLGQEAWPNGVQGDPALVLLEGMSEAPAETRSGLWWHGLVSASGFLWLLWVREVTRPTGGLALRFVTMDSARLFCAFFSLCYWIENQIISTEQHPERGDRGEIHVKQTEL